MTQCIQEQVGILPAIEAEGHLVQVGGEMLRADSVPRSDDAALQERKGGFDCVGVNIAVNVDAILVLDGLVLCGQSILLHGTGVRGEFVGDHDVNILADILSNVFCKRSRLHVRGMEEPQIAAALTNTNDYFFGGAAPRLATTWGPAAHICFVHFDSTRHHGLVNLFHGGPDAMAEIPRGLVADAQSTFDLVRGHSLAGFAEQKRSHEPLLQGQMGVVEDRSSGDSKLIVALFAVQKPRIQPSKNLCVATRAFWIGGPAQAFKQFAAFVIGSKQFNYIRESHREHPN